MLEIRALGPVEALADGEPLALGGPKQRTVLALLIAGADRLSPVEHLIEGVWGDQQAPDRPKGTLQTYVSNLRRVLGDDVVVRDGGGYRLALPRQAVDVWHFEDLVRAGRTARSSDPPGALAPLREALALWRGTPYSSTVHSHHLDLEVRRLEAVRIEAIEDRIEAELAIGGGGELGPELELLIQQHPLRERLRGQYMLLLYRAGRQADALRIYDSTREYLVEELGVDPSPVLQDLQRRILSQDPALDHRAPSTDVVTDAPRGIVTFVWSDVEGAARLGQRLGTTQPEILERHRRLLRRGWEAYHGHEVAADGWSFCVAFQDPGDAVAACAAGQRLLAAEEWPASVGLRDRMGVHTGLASPQDGKYLAVAVDEAAEVMAAGHGAQVLVSERTAELCEPSADVELRALGRFRLRGRTEPMRLYQLVGEGLDDEFPAVRAIPADGHNLVRPTTVTIGREETVAALEGAITPGRLVTLVGPGGVGKTRVAAETGMRIAPRWDGGVWMVDLAPVSDPHLLGVAVADSLGAPVRTGGKRWDAVIDHLAHRHAVLILDNCEHLIDACAQLVGPLLGSCPDIAVVATSREPLHVTGELVWPVQPLEGPHDEHPDAAQVLASPAGRLFAERGAAVRHGFVVDEHNAAEVAGLCRRLDGLPLLLELAAAHLSAQSPAEILAGLDDRALRSPDPLLPDRHRTAEGLLAWSHRLLGDHERAAFRRLSVFTTSFSLPTATTAIAAGDIDTADAPELVWSLVNRSLLTADLVTQATRYRLMETVRRYAQGLLEEHHETAIVATRLARSWLERIGPWSPADRVWTTEVGLEIGNLRGLIPLLPDHELAQQVACTIGRYHDVRQSWMEGIKELTSYVTMLDRPSAARVSLLTTLAYLHLRTGEVPAAEQLARLAEDLRREHGAPDWDDAGVDRTRGEIALRSGRPAEAIGIARNALARPLSDRGRSRMFNLRGIAFLAEGDLVAAFDAFEDELRLSESVGYDEYVASAHGNLAEVALRGGEMAIAAHHQRQCLEYAATRGSPAMLAFSLIVAARIAGSDGAWEVGVRLHARGEALLDEIGLELYDVDRRHSEAWLDAAAEQLDREPFVRAVQAGRDLAIGDAIGLSDDVLAGAQAKMAGVAAGGADTAALAAPTGQGG